MTATVFPSMMRAQPATTCTPFFLSSVATPLVSLVTMPSFHRTVCATSMRGDSTWMPSGESCANCPAFSNWSAAWISAFDGMQPMLRQVPPSVIAFDERGGDAELRSADRRDVAAGTAADDEQGGR